MFVKTGLFAYQIKYDLYINSWDFNQNGPKNRDDIRKWYKAMTELPRLLNGHNSLDDQATKLDLDKKLK